MIQDNIVVFIYSKPKNYYFSSTLHAKNLCLKWFGFFEHIITPPAKIIDITTNNALKFISLLSKN